MRHAHSIAVALALTAATAFVAAQAHSPTWASTPSSAVPFSVIGQFTPAIVPVAWAFQVTVDPFNVPLAVPLIFKSPAQVALNVPLAVLPLCCVTFHLKSEHVLTEGGAA